MFSLFRYVSYSTIFVIDMNRSIYIFSICILLFNCSSSDFKINLDNENTNSGDTTILLDNINVQLKKKIDSFFLVKHRKGLFNGNVLFADKNKVILKKSYGLSNLKKKDSLLIESTFQLASASKPFTAIAVLQLCEKGLINLEDTIQKFIPDFPYSGIDIHQLLSHRSGLSQYTHFCDSPDSIWPNKSKTISNEDVIKIINRTVPLINYPPNKKYYYCNTNYVLLASIVEKVSGLKFSDYLNSYVFIPAGMSYTKLFTRDNFDELHLPAIGYNGNYRKEDNIYLNGCYGDKGIYSNVEDLLKFDLAIKNGTLISASTYELATKNYNDNFRNKQNYGYGFRLMYLEKKGKIVFHTGWWKGFRTYFIQIKDSNQTIIVLSNIKIGPFLKIEALVNLLP